MPATTKPSASDSSTDGKECVVCGVPHYGLHFGVLACAGCAAFFRRTVVQCKSYVCRNDDKCSVRVDSLVSRVTCRACRYRACVSAGMDAGSIRSAATKAATSEPLSGRLHETNAEPANFPQATIQDAQVPTESILASSSNSWPLLDKYVVGIRSYYSAMRSAYFLDNPQHVFADPPFVKYGVPEWMDKERKFAPILYKIVNDQIFPVKELATDHQKRVYRRFTNGFSELFSCWMTAKLYPVTTRVFVSHYGYYLDYDDFVGFYEANGSTADAYHKISAPMLTRSNKQKEKFYSLEIDETELAALTGLWMFAALDHADLLSRDLSQQRDVLLDELHRYLACKVGQRSVGVRMGRLILYLQNLTNMRSAFSDHVILGKIFLPDAWTDLWRLWDEHDIQLPHTNTVKYLQLVSKNCGLPIPI